MLLTKFRSSRVTIFIFALSGVVSACSPKFFGNESTEVAATLGGGALPAPTIVVTTNSTTAESIVSLLSGESVTLSASGGSAPYTYSIAEGSGSITGSVFTASSTVSYAKLRATDAKGYHGDIYVAALGDPEVWVNANDVDGNRDGVAAGATDGLIVPTMVDATGNGFDFVPTVAKEPIWNASDTNYNNQATITLSGGQCLSSAIDFHNELSFTVAMVGNSDGNAGAFYNNTSAGGGEAFQLISLGGVGGDYMRAKYFNGAGLTAEHSSFQASTPNVSIGVLDENAPTATLYYDGVTAYETNAVIPILDLSGGALPTIGSRAPNCAIAPLNGTIAEFIYYGRELSAAEALALSCYLGIKYDVNISGC